MGLSRRMFTKEFKLAAVQRHDNLQHCVAHAVPHNRQLVHQPDIQDEHSPKQEERCKRSPPGRPVVDIHRPPNLRQLAAIL